MDNKSVLVFGSGGKPKKKSQKMTLVRSVSAYLTDIIILLLILSCTSLGK